MEYSFYNSEPQQFSYNAVPENNVQSVYGIPDSSIAADSELFRGLNSIGSHFDAFSPFSPQDQFAPHSSALRPAPPRPQQSSQPLQAPKSLSPESSNEDSAMNGLENGLVRNRSNRAALEPGDRQSEQNHDGSEEGDPNSMPAQDRRKLQNRAAQRAFRERKERHVKELEAKLQTLSSASNNLQSDNERLKRELAALSTQNEILRATHARPPSSASNPGAFHHQQMRRPPSPTMGPQSFTPTDFVVATGGEITSPLKFDVYPNPRGRMLMVGAAWDYIQRDKRVEQGQIDLEELCKKLKGKAICDGRGPAFKEDELKSILDECAAGTMNDDLL